MRYVPAYLPQNLVTLLAFVTENWPFTQSS